ncbi:mechanosensitive ion channel [Candidatus Gracilibacteria bacterium]|nr:mechanosensitive ion channel [Candidatus Gracilibacteria bacterium]MCF7819604.1 mechanosensitive ion channel [Candidatus Gracilibacteria bacterium]
MIFSIAHAASQLQTTQDQTTGGLSQLFADLLSSIPFWIAAVVVFFASILLAKFLKSIVIYRVTARAKHEMKQEVIILIGRSVYFGVVLLGTIIAFQIVGIDVATLLGFIGLGLGFALKDLLANFIAGVVILTQKKFHIGDTVKVNDIVGKIVEIETRTTQIQDFDGTVHIIPNAEMLTSVVRNFTQNSFRRITLQVGVHYNTPLKQAVDLTLKSVTAHEEVVPQPATQVLITEFGDSAIMLEARFWIESIAAWPKIKSKIMQQLKQDYDSAGITIPFPMRTLTLDSYDKNLLQACGLKDQPQQGNVSVPQEAPSQ